MARYERCRTVAEQMRVHGLAEVGFCHRDDLLIQRLSAHCGSPDRQPEGLPLAVAAQHFTVDSDIFPEGRL